MGLKKWCVSEYNKELAKSLAYECEVDPIVALIASARGYEDPTELEQFISDEPYFSDFYQCADIIKAAEIVNEAIKNNEKIAIYGDYDCDGVSATALLFGYLKSKNANCIYYIPDRFEEGYGMNEQAVRYLKEQNVELIVTVDNGISSIEEIALANSLGIKTVVTDHHLPGEVLPEAEAVVNPHRKDCPSDYKTVCGAEVAFRLVCVMENKEPEELIFQYADLLALATVADVMPLTLENRTIVKCGVQKLLNSPNIGLSALLSVAGIAQDSVNSARIAFGLSPRINAAGRMGKADRAVQLLLCQNMMEALNIANEIDAENSARQQIERKICEEVIDIVEAKGYKHDRVIVVVGEGWHHGVVGIVASRISEKYGVPCIILSSEGDISCGSGRSFEGFSLYNAINAVKDLTVKFGGHEQAAGITLKTEDIDEFRRRINEYARGCEFATPKLSLDCKLNPSALSLDLAFALKVLEPYGNANQIPLFGVFGARLDRITPIGNNKHLRLLFSKGSNSFQALLFGVKSEEFCFEIGDVLDLAVNIDANYFKGEYSVSVQIKAIRLSATDDEKLFNDLKDYNDFMSGNPQDTNSLLPTREEVGEVYRYILEKSVLEERVKYLFRNKIGFGKTLVAIKTLEELGLIENISGRLSGVYGAVKTSLMNSKTFKTLSERSGVYE